MLSSRVSSELEVLDSVESSQRPRRRIANPPKQPTGPSAPKHVPAKRHAALLQAVPCV